MTEQCLADHPDDWNEELGTMCARAECRNGPCPEPGSRRCDPYAAADTGCPQTGSGGWHSESFLDGGTCARCGLVNGVADGQ